ncbi:hypothetical protein D3C77_629010 [compost metagenome]
MLSKRTDDFDGAEHERLAKLESVNRLLSVARLFEIDRAIGAEFQKALSELDKPNVISLVQFLAELDILAKEHHFSSLEIITLLDPMYLERNAERFALYGNEQ